MEIITYEQIENANKTIKTTDVKGKDYAEVNQRIKAFRMCCPNGSIITEIINHSDGIVLMQAKVYDGNDKLIGTGLAQEKENSSYINKTSYIENCETSAVGRALGMCGFGIDVSVASAEEVQNAINNQETKPTKNQTNKKGKEDATTLLCTAEQLELLKVLYDEENQKKMLDFYKVKELKDLTVAQASQAIKRKEILQNGTN